MKQKFLLREEEQHKTNVQVLKREIVNDCFQLPLKSLAYLTAAPHK
jgi:hypothetical protein